MYAKRMREFGDTVITIFTLSQRYFICAFSWSNANKKYNRFSSKYVPKITSHRKTMLHSHSTKSHSERSKITANNECTMN